MVRYICRQRLERHIPSVVSLRYGLRVDGDGEGVLQKVATPPCFEGFNR